MTSRILWLAVLWSVGRRWLELKWLTEEVKDKDGKMKLQSSKAGDSKG